ncbi:GNAT family N-acetyltransferase [Tissierella sp. P1]|uniref:GNAT family N-acetyltransferase n=1 Tax=Tissierella sp. P1 TaxID=1280483 RepID=UPI001303E967|nr:GNAT family N-acetyltransferase [Tissierella sp. P1]
MNIILKTRTLDHVTVFWNKTQDEEIKRLFPIVSKSLEESIILFEESLKENASSYGKVIYFEGKYIGDIWCYSIDENSEKMAMLSILIFEKELWGRGIATEVTKIFVKEVFSKFDIEKIGAFTYSNNYGSISLMVKVGFIEIEKFVEDGIESKYFEIIKAL